MANKKITDLTADTTPTSDDLIATVDDVAGTPTTKKSTIANLFFSLKNMVFGTDAGSTDTYAATLDPAPAAYVTGQAYRFKANTANTGACTINFNTLGAKTIKKAAGGITTDLADNDIRAGQWVDLVYDGTNMQMQSLLGNGGSGISSLNALTGGTQTFATTNVTGAGTDMTIVSSSTTHTFNWPDASTLNRGVISVGTQGFSGFKTFNDGADFKADTAFRSGSNNCWYWHLNNRRMQIASNVGLVWSNTSDSSNSTIDVGFYRNAAGVMEIDNGNPGTFRDLLARGLRSNAVTFANAIGSPVEGTLQAFTDSTTSTPGATITGSGSNHVLGYYNGTNWKVVV